MGRPLYFRFDSFDNYFCLKFTDCPREPTAVWQDDLYEYRFQLIRGLRTGEIKGFSNDGGDLAQDYPRLMELLAQHPIPGLYDVPNLNLTDATLPQIITAIYERYVATRRAELQQVYPVVGAQAPVLQVADRPADKSQTEE